MSVATKESLCVDQCPFFNLTIERLKVAAKTETQDAINAHKEGQRKQKMKCADMPLQ